MLSLNSLMFIKSSCHLRGTRILMSQDTCLSYRRKTRHSRDNLPPRALSRLTVETIIQLLKVETETARLLDRRASINNWKRYSF